MSPETRTAPETSGAASEHSSRSPLAWLTPGRGAMIVSALAFILYFITMNRTFGFVDKGELVAVASTLGISHPTGYPTIMILGWLFTKILPVRPVLALNIMSALLTAAGTGVLALLFNDLIRRMDAGARRIAELRKGKKAKGKKGAGGTTGGSGASGAHHTAPERMALAALMAFFVGFTATWWNQGNGFEVYSLHALLMPLVTLLFFRYVDQDVRREAPPLPEGDIDLLGWIKPTKLGFWFAFLLGLSFTNHGTTILLAPAFLAYFFWKLNIASGSTWKRITSLALPFLLGLLPYAWLPIRASMEPMFNWGNPVTWWAFKNHITGKIYQEYMFDDRTFEDWTVFGQQFSYFSGNLPSEVAYIGLPLAAAGIIYLLMRNRSIALWSLLLFGAGIFYASYFEIMEIGPYYMTAVFAIGIWCLMGILWIRENAGSTITIGLAALLAVANCASNWNAADESGNTVVEDMTVNMLNTLPKDAIIFSAQWDFWVAGSFYMQGVEKMRPDVLVIDPELLRRTWYLDQLTYTYPEFMAAVKPEVDAFREKVHYFDHELGYDGEAIQRAYIGMMNAMIDRNIARRPIAVTGEVDPMVGARYRRTPYHLTLRLMPDSAYLPQEFPTYRFAHWEGRVDGYVAKAYELYARSAVGRALYERQYGQDSLALRYVDLALSFDPGFSANAIPDMPLNGEEQISGMIGFFEQVRGLKAQMVSGR